ncbi:MAG: mono/diheme cytochrome c family protein [Candidatus Binatia bacterium]|jgi:mono/diheme cytochrome c family protein
MNRRLFISIALFTGLAIMTVHSVAQDAPELKTAPGVRVQFTALDAPFEKDFRVLAGISLFVPKGQSPTAFLPRGRFQTVWEGFISVNLRDRYTFRVETKGSYRIEIDDSVALEGVSEDGAPSEPSKRVRLGKGNNKIKVIYSSPEKGDAYFRLYWSSPDFGFEPLPASALSRIEADTNLTQANLLRDGRALFAEHRCQKCHTDFAPKPGMLELSMDAPTFEGIGSRRGRDWMRKWILDPGAFRTVARMPKIFHGPTAEKDAAATAAYLATLTDNSDSNTSKAPLSDLFDKGAELFTILHCAACHQEPEKHDPQETKISLRFVNEKFTAGSLVAFLKQPEAHYAWIRMPNFKLSDAEADQLAAFLRGKATGIEAINSAVDDTEIKRGKGLVESAGCLNCHTSPGENKFTFKTKLASSGAQLIGGCLADSSKPGSPAPHYALADNQRAVLRAFLKTSTDSLARHVPTEFAKRQIQSVGCANCHGKVDGFPKLDILGGKLKPEWSERFIAGHIDYKPRYWLATRMPAFETRARGIAQGMAMEHGYAPATPKPPKIDPAMAAAGRKMVGTDGGFSCIACHAVKDFGASQVFESAGVNFSQVGNRLMKPFFQRWLMNPLRVDPGTKMPVYFPGGESMLFDYYDGDAKKQIDAFWEYIRQGDKMQLPEEATQ